MSRYPAYLRVVVIYMGILIAIYMGILIAGATLTVMEVCGLSATDSFYYVVQTLWTVGYGDVTLPGESGRVLSIAIMLFGTVGITSALGVVGGMVLDHHARRHDSLEREVEDNRRRNLEGGTWRPSTDGARRRGSRRRGSTARWRR